MKSLFPVEKITRGSVDFSPGQGPVTLGVVGLPPFSPLICYEVIFPGAVTGPGTRPEWLLNITNDAWFGRSAGPYQHFAAARMRAVEEGIPLVRVANTGITAIVDAYGRVLDRLGVEERGFIDTNLPPPARSRTLYSRFGNSLALIPLLIVVGMVLLIERRPDRVSGTIPPRRE